VLENRVLRRIFETNRDEVTKEWRKLRNEEINDLYSSRDNVIYKNEMGGACSTFGERRRIQIFWLGNMRKREHVKT
jgi:DNA gyrase/topoisomerase IV subunit A